MVDEAVGDTRFLGDLADAAGVVALARKGADGRIEDLAPLLFL